MTDAGSVGRRERLRLFCALQLPADVVAGTRARYVEAFERLTGIRFDDYVRKPEIISTA